MVTREEIQAACDDIVREFAPLQVILFGSYAYGTPTEDSDVDLLVVMDIPKEELLALIVPMQPDRSDWQPDFKLIMAYAVDPRYPGDSATAENTQHAMHICGEVRQAVRTQLKLEMSVD